MKLKTGPPYTEDKRRLKGRGNHVTLVGGRFNEQRNLHMRLVKVVPRGSDIHIHLPES